MKRIALLHLTFPLLTLSACSPEPIDSTVADSPALVDEPADPMAAALTRVAAADRAFGRRGESLHAVHRSLSLDIRLDDTSTQLRGPMETVGLRFTGWGRQGDLAAVGAEAPIFGDCSPELGPDGACIPRAERHSDAAIEWWQNGVEGPRQGWELSRRPAGRGPVVLQIDVEGAEAVQEGPEVRLRGEGGGDWRYADLRATDAAGVELKAWFEVDSNQIRILVDDSGARWPIEIDPVMTTAYVSFAGTAPLDAFGTGVTGGDFNNDGYDDVAIGAPGFNGGVGAVYIFNGSSSGPSATASQTLSAPSGGGYFGAAVDNAYDVNNDGYADLVVGAPNSLTSATNDGAAWVYHGSSAGLASTPVTKLTGSLASNNYFGCSVAGAGDVNGDGYDDIIVGEYGYSSETGRAWIYAGSASGVSTTTYRTLTGTATGMRFGWTVAGGRSVSSDAYAETAVGAPYYLSGSSVHAGRVIVYTGASTFFTSTPTTTTYTGTAGYEFGTAISLEGSYNGDAFADMVIGAPFGSSTGLGRVYYYQSTGSALPTGNTRTFDGPAVASAFGGRLAAVGDTDGDGYEELLVGAPYYTSFAGYAALYDGGSTGLVSTNVARTFAGTGTNYLGAGISGVGDVNGDGEDDIVIGSPGANLGTGSATLHLGGVDADNDGWVVNGSGLSEDCDDSNSSIHPGATEICDEDDVDEDCDGQADDSTATGQSTFYQDSDNDGYGDPTVSVTACDAPSGYVEDNTDCDDTKGNINPSATEVCDAYNTDENCDGQADDSSADSQLTWYADGDSDGYGDIGSSTLACDQPTGYVTSSDDCDDGDSGVHPGATEVCDANDTDENCNGVAEESSATGQQVWFLDADSDGFGFAGSSLSACDAPSGYVQDDTDCDDGDSGVNPSAAEVCDPNNRDENCDGSAEESGASGERAWFADSDNDGYGDPNNALTSCDPPSGTVGDDTDCDDNDAAVNPGATEICDPNAVDEDCDGSADDSSASGQFTWYADSDGDGYGDRAPVATACEAPSGTVSNDSDCDDGNNTVHPGAAEFCDPNDVDENCDGLADDSTALGQTTFYADNDNDGYGNGLNPLTACDLPNGYVTDRTDCDDNANAVHPGAVEVCDPNDVDEDCDRLADDASALGQTTFYADADNDGFGDLSSPRDACDAPSGYVSDATDCDDGDSGDNPDATEIIANGDDEDCDGGEICYTDADGDGFRDGEVELTSADADCDDAGEAQLGTPDGDCDDADAAYNPDASETDCGDPNDYNCDGSVGYDDADADGFPACQECDDGDANINPSATEIVGDGVDEDCDGQEECWFDADNDGYLDGSGSTVLSADADCIDGTEAPDGTPDGDCDDSNSGANPGLPEICDDLDIDEDCDGQADDASAAGQLAWYADLDNDGYGDAAALLSACDAPAGYLDDASDCDDGDSGDYPGAIEVIGNGDDEDCDGGEICLTDADGDGYRPDETQIQSSDGDCDDPGEALAGAPDGDCDDGDSAYNPGATESDCLDPNDYNCDGSVGYSDNDSDGFAACEECDDSNNAIHPGATEIVGDAIDQNCDGHEVCLLDNDDDGFVTGEGLTLESDDVDCLDTKEADAQAPDGDCDDDNADANPDAADIPDDGIDQDCDGQDATTDDTGTDDTGTDDSGTDDSGADDSDGPDDSAGTDDSGTEGKDKGCGCTSGGTPAVGLMGAVLGLALTRRRRR